MTVKFVVSNFEGDRKGQGTIAHLKLEEGCKVKGLSRGLMAEALLAILDSNQVELRKVANAAIAAAAAANPKPVAKVSVPPAPVEELYWVYLGGNISSAPVNRAAAVKVAASDPTASFMSDSNRAAGWNTAGQMGFTPPPLPAVMAPPPPPVDSEVPPPVDDVPAIPVGNGNGAVHTGLNGLVGRVLAESRSK